MFYPDDFRITEYRLLLKLRETNLYHSLYRITPSQSPLPLESEETSVDTSRNGTLSENPVCYSFCYSYLTLCPTLPFCSYLRVFVPLFNLIFLSLIVVCSTV